MTVRAATPDDAADILRIVHANGLPAEWRWTPGGHGVVADDDGRVVAFAIVSENPWGVVCEELWEIPNDRRGYRGLALIAAFVERVAADVADRRGHPIMVGGIVRVEKAAHIAALRKRGYGTEAEVLTKVVRPRGSVVYVQAHE